MTRVDYAVYGDLALYLKAWLYIGMSQLQALGYENFRIIHGFPGEPTGININFVLHGNWLIYSGIVRKSIVVLLDIHLASPLLAS